MRILWDFDGTIFDTYPLMVQAAQQAIQKYGITIEKEELLKRMKRSSFYAFQSLGLQPDRLLNEMISIAYISSSGTKTFPLY